MEVVCNFVCVLCVREWKVVGGKKKIPYIWSNDLEESGGRMHACMLVVVAGMQSLIVVM